MRASPNVPPMVAFGLVAVACLAPAPARAQDPATADKEKRQRLERQFQESLGWYQVSAGPNSGVMKPRPVLRWLNPTRGQKGEPTLILWTDAGRPQALASVYPWGTNLTYECVSLARGEGLTAREEGRTVWAPGAAGVTFRGLPDAPAPAATAAGRLKQAKALAERFKVALVSTDRERASREELRMLATPIYRYEIDGAKAAHPDLIDGAVFAFVQGTDPEAVLLVEAVRQGGGIGWQYAFGRATGYDVEARLGSSVVWSTPPWTNDVKSTSRAIGRPLVE
jgi:hypothetical protein